MASLWARLKRVNWDDTLAYSTVKTVTVRDYRLGLVHYFCLLLIALYIIVWSVRRRPRAWEQRGKPDFCAANRARAAYLLAGRSSA